MKLKKIFFLCFFFAGPALLAGPSYILCIDGGATKTILQVLDSEGALVTLTKNNIQSEKIEASGSNITAIGKEGVRAAFRDLFVDVQLGRNSTPLVDILPSSQVVAGMAGVTVAQDRQSVITLFEEYGIKKEHIILMNDAEISLQLIDDQGIILASGTGSVCFAKKGHTQYRVGGLGRILGDEGSGYQIALNALKMALADEYGWGRPTSLTNELKKFFNVNELKVLILKVNSGELAHGKIAKAAPLVFQEAERGDRIANRIIDLAAHELAELLITQLKISHLSHCEVHLWGGVFKGRSADKFIRKIMNIADPHGTKKLKAVNKSFNMAAIHYAQKFILGKEVQSN